MAKSDPSGPLSGASEPDTDERPSTEPRQTSEPSARRSPADQFRSEAAARQSGDADEEQVRWSGGYSPRAMLGTWIGVAVLSVAAVIVAVMFADTIPWWVVVVAVLLLWLIVAGVYAVRRLGMHYELTTQRFVHQSGIISRRTDRIEVIDIDDVICVQGPVQRMMGVGTIRITSSDRSHPELAMPGIANVRDVAGLIDDIRRKERRRRSLHIESI